MTGAARLVVSVHDVAPPHWVRVRRMLDALAGVGVTRRSLLVIPNFQGRWPIDQDEGLCAGLRGLERDGDEIVLHGYEHVGVGEPRGVVARFKNRWFTDGEGEFLSLDYRTARDRIERGLGIFDRAGLDPRGFVAPAWLINADGLRAAGDCGLEYTNSYFTLSDLRRGDSHLVPSLVFGPGHLNEDVGIALQERAAALLALGRNVRIVLHPPCIDHPVRFGRILGMIETMRRGHEPATYFDLLGGLREAEAAAS